MTLKKTILLVDDDADFIDMHKAVLENHGYEVLAASNGDECLATARAKQPDLIVLDVIMNTPSEGFDTARELRNCDQTKGIPLLMVTSVHEKVPYRFAPDETWLPVDEFIEKPLAPQDLLERVGRRLERKGTGSVAKTGVQ
ncbi:MAG: response regulator [Pirellulales bacterium]